MKPSWYLGLMPDQVGRRCILVGDPGRVDLFAAELSEARLVTENRGLRTVTGRFSATPVTVTAFGMGAPIAAVVLEELAGLGAEVVLRAGTALSVDPALPLGSFVVAEAGFRGEGTSLSYAPADYPAVADSALTATVTAELARSGLAHRVGVIASVDGFFTELVALRPEREAAVRARLDELRRHGVIAADMETSAVLVVGSLLGVRVGSLCLVSVDGATRTKLDDAAREPAERQLVQVALRAVTAAEPISQPLAAGHVPRADGRPNDA